MKKIILILMAFLQTAAAATELTDEEIRLYEERSALDYYQYLATRMHVRGFIGDGDPGTYFDHIDSVTLIVSPSFETQFAISLISTHYFEDSASHKLYINIWDPNDLQCEKNGPTEKCITQIIQYESELSLEEKQAVINETFQNAFLAQQKIAPLIVSEDYMPSSDGVGYFIHFGTKGILHWLKRNEENEDYVSNFEIVRPLFELAKQKNPDLAELEYLIIPQRVLERLDEKK